MFSKERYSNGQKAYDLMGDVLTYFYKNGKVKAKGRFVDGLMEGEWTFFRETGQLWQVGHFERGNKKGPWIRYDRKGSKEFEKVF
ncbi:MAG: toxin-antitoxin system YwqK family antitoxin [Methanomassiliicoccales archaeon]